jgi:hypothetical protein
MMLLSEILKLSYLQMRRFLGKQTQRKYYYSEVMFDLLKERRRLAS